MAMKLYNTLKHSITKFETNPDHQVRLYTCGPTVYDNVHIGNLRAYISADILRRALLLNGYKVNWVMNITDVDDKTISKTIKESGNSSGVPELEKFTDKYYRGFLEYLEEVNIPKNEIDFVKVTEKISEIQTFILDLIEKGYGYKAEDGSTYFSIEKYQKDFGDYGALVGEKFLEGKKIGARVKVDEYEKENLSDFALWKAHHPSDGGIFWDHPILGKGRPGWHIECTLINYLKFPEGTDIHTGGVDLIFPHHTNEIAQAQPIYKPFTKYWIHSEHILVENKKMAKSAGNFYTLSDLKNENICSGSDLRFLILQSHYKTRFNITLESLKAAKSGLRKLREEIGLLVSKSNNFDLPNQEFIEKFHKAIDNDLNTPEAIALLYAILKSPTLTPDQKLSTIFKMDEVFGLDLENTYTPVTDDIHNIEPEIQDLLEKRKQAKEQKNYALSDEIRLKIEELGYEVTDSPSGTKLKRKAE